MKLFTEDVKTNLKVISESTETSGDKKRMFIEGIFMETGPNHNKRFYDMESVLLPEVKRYVTEKVQTNRALGELGHPPTPTINGDRACIKIISLEQCSDTAIRGKALVLNTPMGKIVQGLIDDGVSCGVSSRGLGSMNFNESTGLHEVQNDFRLATAADVVTDPSAPNAFVEGIMEGVEWLYQNGEYVAVQAATQIEEATRSRALTEERKLALFNQYLKNLVR